MESYSKIIQLRWADLDPNFHVLHSRYYDFGALCRMSFLVENGFTPAIMQQHHCGPILFREECTFRRELGFSDEVRINLTVTSGTHNFSRWSMQHDIYKNGDVLSAVIKVDGAWLNTQTRKLAPPPDEAVALFSEAPKSQEFNF
ncbi:MAG: thioesterase family protein [Ferruginibacter sp.]